MGLTVSETGGKEFSIIPEGSYVAICNMLVDLGLQYNEAYKNSSRKVLIGWELPEETIEINGETVLRTINQRYTASLNEKSILRRDLSAWRGRDFTPAELAEFNLRNIVGAPCMIQIIHKEYNGKKYANVASIMTLPKGMPKPVLSGEPVVYDIDDNDPADVEKLPEWIKTTIKGSESYTARVLPAASAEFEDLDNVEEPLPF
jgi:hypothetical protein